MIDKLDSLLPQNIRYGPRAAHLFALAEKPEVRSKVIRSGAGQGYNRILDFRPVGHPVMVMETNLRSKDGGNKLIHFETAKYGLPEIKANFRRIYDFDMDEARVSRIDCAVDVPATVQYFRENSHVKFKGKIENYRDDPRRDVSKRGAETMYAGMKPNEWRVYDKNGERMAELVRWNARQPNTRRMPMDELIWFFGEKFGIPYASTVTRVERQMGGYDPKKNGLHLVGDLQKLRDFYPFENLILPKDCRFDDLEALPFRDRCIVLELRRKAHGPFGVGLQNTKQWYGRQRGVGKNLWRNWKKFYPFLADVSAEVNHDTLRSAFEAGVTRQLYGLPAAA